MENPHQHCCCLGKLEARLVPSVCLWFVPPRTRFSSLCKHAFAHPTHHPLLLSGGTAQP